jgi:hypothetical protein
MCGSVELGKYNLSELEIKSMEINKIVVIYI